MTVKQVVIIVPYRDDPEHNRSTQLAKFLDHFNEFFPDDCSVQHFLYVVEQAEYPLKFNKGQLLNSGFDLACKELTEKGLDVSSAEATLFVFHDLDMLPAKELLAHYVRPMTEGGMRLVEAAWQRYNRYTPLRSSAYFQLTTRFLLLG
jgi:hypothetical protein